MKKFIVLGSGTAGLIAATMIKKTWKDKVQVSLYYDSNKKNIGVGESTTPSISYFLRTFLNVDFYDFLKDTGSTIKLGINFKNWIPKTQFFHGFQEVDIDDALYPESLYSILNGDYAGGINYNKPSTTLPNHGLNFLHALHIDTQAFSTYVHERIKNHIEIVDDVAEKVIVDGENIKSIIFKNSGEVSADFYIDASGFNEVLIKHLNSKKIDISKYLPIDRAIPQQIEYDFVEVPSYTEAEATKNGWIWKIPIGNRYGTGYTYSSKFTTDEDAKKDYDKWLNDNFNVNLETDKIIKYSPGYYEDHWVGNCMAVGLSSGFIEPLEATGIHLIVMQMKDFIEYNITLKNLNYNRVECNRRNAALYKEILEFVCLHYNTNRTDSEFWKYMTDNKLDWVKCFDEKCREEFLEKFSIEKGKEFWHVDSYIQVAQGLEMFNPEALKNYIDLLPNGEQILERCRSRHESMKMSKQMGLNVPHRSILNGNIIQFSQVDLNINDRIRFV